MISEERLTQAMKFLAETDSKSAELKTDVKRRDYVKGKVKALMFLHAEGTVPQRHAIAETSDEVDGATMDYLDAHQESLALDNKRRTEELVVDVWRSINANRRQGNIT